MTGIGDKTFDTNGSVFLKLVKSMMTDKFTGCTEITSRMSHPLKTEGLNFLFELQDFNQSFRFYLFNFISLNYFKNYFFISFRLFGSSSFDESSSLKPKWFWACQMDEVVNLQTEFM